MDKEAYNSLIRCYYETCRYEYAIQLCDQLLANKDLRFPFLYNNRLLCQILLGKKEFTKFEKSTNPFIAYNLALLQPQNEFYNVEMGLTLKSKLLFQEVRHENLRDDTNRFWLDNLGLNNQIEVNKAILTLGRTGYQNDIVFGNTQVSRKHAVIINQKNDLWIYDLSSTGTWVDGIRVIKRTPLLYNSNIEFNGFFGRFISSLDNKVV